MSTGNPHSHPKTAEASSTGDMQAEKRYRIAHLSDLHFGKGFSADNWRYVRELLTAFRPHLVLVTGDVVDSPSLFALAMARNELDSLVADLSVQSHECEYAIVRGNHDVGLLGNVYSWPWRGKYRLVFSRRYAVFDQIGTWSTHCDLTWGRRILRRIVWGARLTVQRLFLSLRDPGETLFPVLVIPKQCQVVLAQFNSNDAPWLATGRISASALMSLERDLETLGCEEAKAYFGTRIALLHHHALAIPYSTASENLTSFEPFLALRNSGDLLHVMGLSEFDLVLHGHKHYRNFARVSFDAPVGDASEVAVVAAGSATMAEPESGLNSFNLFEIAPNGIIAHRQVRFGRGMTAQASEALANSGQRYVNSASAVKERQYRKALQRLQLTCAVMERTWEIDKNGACNWRSAVQGLRVTGVRSVEQYPFRFGVGTGAIAPASIKLDQPTTRRGHQFAEAPRDRATMNADCPIRLAAQLYRDQDPIDLTVECRTVNTFATSNWEAGILPDFGDFDWVSISVRHPAERLHVTLRLPTGFQDPQPSILVQRPVGYPTLEIGQEFYEVKMPSKEKDWELDEEMTQLESSTLVASGGRHGYFELSIEKPLVGYRYVIRWSVNTSEDHARRDPKSIGTARQLRDSLLSMLSGRSGSPEDLRTYGQQLLEDMMTQLLVPTFRSQYDLDESMVASLYVLNESANPPNLRQVLKSKIGREVDDAMDTVPLTQGVVGTAFKRRRMVGFAPYDVLGIDTGGAYEYYVPVEGKEPKLADPFSVIVAIPVFLTHDRKQWNMAPDEVIGVFTFGSTARDSGLLRLLDLSSSHRDNHGHRNEAGNDDESGQLWKLAFWLLHKLAEKLSSLPQSTCGEQLSNAANAVDKENK